MVTSAYYTNCFVTPQGFEPQFLRSERNVLPLDDGVSLSMSYLPAEALAKGPLADGVGYLRYNTTIMQTIDELCAKLKLNPQQVDILKAYITELIVDLLESIKQDNIRNFDETIDNLKN